MDEISEKTKLTAESLIGETAHELLKRTHWLTAVLENLPLGLLLMSTGGHIVRANDAFLDLSRIDSIDSIDHSSDLAPWNETEGFHEGRIECITKGDVVRKILELPDGRYFTGIFIPVTSNGESNGVLLMVKDVTTDEVSARRFDAFAELFDEGILILDTDYTLVWANDVFRRWFNAGDDYVGLPCRKLFENKREFCKNCTVAETFSTGLSHRCFEVAEIEGVGGRTFEILTGPVKNSRGEIVQVVKIIRDVTDRENVVIDLANTKMNLESANVQLTRRIDELAMLMELSEALQAVDNLDENLHIFLTAVTAREGCGFNRAFLFLLNRDKGELVGRYAVGPSSPEEAGRIWSELASEKINSFADALKTYRKAMADGDIEVNTIIANLRFDIDDTDNLLVKSLDSTTPKIFKDALNNPESRELAETLRTEDFAVVPLFAMGRPVGVLVVDNVITKADISELGLKLVKMLAGHASLAIERGMLTSKIAEQYEKLQEAYEKLRENQELLLRTEKLSAIGKLSAQMAHEIRNPLVSIGGFARNILKKAPDGSSIRKGAGIILEEVDRLEGIVDDVLSYSRSFKPHCRNTDINGLIARTVEMIEDQFERAGVEVELELEESIGEISIDPEQIRQVFLNLFKNSISAMPDGGTLKVVTKCYGGFVWTEVIDTGVGIPSDYEGKIFEPFFTTKSSGTGLGLSISFQIIEAHSGMLWFSSHQNEGTTFFIKLPQRVES